VAQADPNDQRAAEAVAGAQARLGIALSRTGDLTGAEREYRAAIAGFDALIRRDRSDWRSVFAKAMALDDLAVALEQRCDKGACPAAIDELDQEASLLERLRVQGVLPHADEHWIADARAHAQKLRRGAHGIGATK
jgi:hypothetical protein